MKSKLRPLFHASVITLLALGSPAFSASLTWDAGVDMNWNTSTDNWVGAATWNNATPDQAVFGATGIGTVNLTTGITANKLTFDSAGYTISGNTLTLGGTTPTLTANADATISSNLSSTTFITKNGAGKLTLTGTTSATSVDDSVRITAGTLEMAASTLGSRAFQIINGGTILMSGGTWNANCSTNPIIGNTASGAAANLTQTSGAMNLTGTANVLYSSNATGQTSSLNFSGGTFSAAGFQLGMRANSTATISNSAQVTLSTSFRFGHTIVISGGNVSSRILNLGDGATFNGGTSIINGGTSGILATAQIIKPAEGNSVVNFNGGTLRATGTSQTYSSYMQQLTSANVLEGGGIIDTQTNNVTIGQALLHGGVGTDGGLVKKGSGVLTLNGVNTYTGATTIREGTLALGASATISSNLTLGASAGGTGTLDITAKASPFSQASIAGNGTINISATNAKTINVTTSLAPGFSAGTLNVTGNLSIVGDTVATTMELAANSGLQGTASDDINVTGTLTLDGALNIISYNGYNLAQSAAYDLFDATAFAGNFDSVSVGGTALSFNIPSDIWTGTSGSTTYSFNETNGVLTVVPEPGSALLGGLGLLALLRRRRA